MNHKRKRVLVVDDLPMNQILMGKILDKYSLHYEFASNGLQALHKLEQQEFDIILMDLQMPVMNGFEAIKKIRTELSAPARTTPIIGVSASIFNEELRKCIELGANDVIEKPYEAEDLYNKIRELLSEEDKSVTSVGIVVEEQNVTYQGKQQLTLTNLEYLEQYAAGDKDFMKEMLSFFCENTPKMLNQMKAASAAEDYETLYQLAHKFAPQLTFVGITSLVPLVEETEKLCKRTRDAARISELLEEVASTSEKAIEELKKSEYL